MTKPTTINAMTDIPANIPRPIGSTEIFFPGIWKADAAALADDEAVALSAADVPLLDKEVVVAPDNDTVLVGSGSAVDATGFGSTELEGVGVEDEDDAVEMLARGTEEKTTEGTEDDAEVVVDVLSAEEVEEVVDEEEREVDVEVVVDGGAEEMVDELLPDWATADTVHCRTTCTRGSPFGPLTGVIVIVHVSVTSPESVSNVCTVWVTIDSESGLPSACRR